MSPPKINAHDVDVLDMVARKAITFNRELLADVLERAQGYARARAFEEAAALCEQSRSRQWSPGECAMAIRRIDHPPSCGMWRWQPCDCPVRA